jgi:hypothetical protein
MITESWTGKDVEENSSGIIWGTTPAFSPRAEENHFIQGHKGTSSYTL